MSVGEPVGAWPPRVRDGAPADPPTGPVVTVTVTCVDDGRSHAVPDTELTSTASPSGCYRAVCGHVVTAAPMVAPEGTPCPTCDEARSAKPSRASRRLGLRLLGG